MPAQYVKAYVKRNKNDAADAAAICEAVMRPTMRFVPVKTADQQAAVLLHPEEIKLLTKQGEQLAATGDLVTARILFQRAAEVGDATAAMALGATYDPNVLAKLGVAGMAADVQKARSWYRKAQSQGSAEATRRLPLL